MNVVAQSALVSAALPLAVGAVNAVQPLSETNRRVEGQSPQQAIPASSNGIRTNNTLLSADTVVALIPPEIAAALNDQAGGTTDSEDAQERGSAASIVGVVQESGNSIIEENLDALTAPRVEENTDQSGLTEEEQLQVSELQARDAEVRRHEQAHAAVGGQYASAPSYTYQQGPDGQLYAIGGEVQIDTAPIPNDPEATIEKLQVVIAAALAPAEPSAQDLNVAAQATQGIAAAAAEAAAQRFSGEGETDDTGESTDASEASAGVGIAPADGTEGAVAQVQNAVNTGERASDNTANGPDTTINTGTTSATLANTVANDASSNSVEASVALQATQSFNASNNLLRRSDATDTANLGNASTANLNGIIDPGSLLNQVS